MRRLLTVIVFALVLALPGDALALTDPLLGQQWNLFMVESGAAHALATGTGAKIAIIDTGIEASHPDLQGTRFLQGYDFVDNDPIPQDGNGHGTHVLGIAGASEANGTGVGSVAPGATILPVRVLGDDGTGDLENVVRGIDYAVAQGADIINLSLGSEAPVEGTPGQFNAAIDRALDAGRIVVGAAGNDGLPVCGQPSGEGRMLCVGAVDRRRTHSSFSNYGIGLGLVAPGGSGQPVPGENVLSTYRDDYAELAGTSQAAPHVSGVAALLVQRGVRGQAAVRRILATAADVGSPGPDPLYGAGVVNARLALSAPGAPSATATQANDASQVVVSLPSRARIRTVLRRGIRVRCRASGSGRCRVGAYRGRLQVAAGSARLRIGRTAVVVARVTRRGRSLLRRALRRRRTVALRVRVRLPGAPAQIHRLTLLP